METREEPTAEAAATVEIAREPEQSAPLDGGPGADETAIQIPAELPLLPLKEHVLFPAVVAPLTVTREASIKLVDDAAVANNRVIGVVTLANEEHHVEESLQKVLAEADIILGPMVVGHSVELLGHTIGTAAGLNLKKLRRAWPPLEPLSQAFPAIKQDRLRPVNPNDCGRRFFRSQIPRALKRWNIVVTATATMRNARAPIETIVSGGTCSAHQGSTLNFAKVS